MSTTESYSKYNNLDSITTFQILNIINSEDKTVPYVIEKSLDKIEQLINRVYKRMEKGGRLFYIGSRIHSKILEKIFLKSIMITKIKGV